MPVLTCQKFTTLRTKNCRSSWFHLSQRLHLHWVNQNPLAYGLIITIFNLCHMHFLLPYAVSFVAHAFFYHSRVLLPQACQCFIWYTRVSLLHSLFVSHTHEEVFSATSALAFFCHTRVLSTTLAHASRLFFLPCTTFFWPMLATPFPLFILAPLKGSLQSLAESPGIALRPSIYPTTSLSAYLHLHVSLSDSPIS